MEKSKSFHADILGISTSTICVIHCSLLPLMMGVGIFESGDWIHSLALELSLLILTIIFASYSLIQSFFKKHQNKYPILLAILGIGIFCIGLIYHNSLGLILCSMGGISLATAHFINYKLCHIH